MVVRVAVGVMCGRAGCSEKYCGGGIGMRWREMGGLCGGEGGGWFVGASWDFRVVRMDRIRIG